MHRVAPTNFFGPSSLDWWNFMNVFKSQVEKGSRQAAKIKHFQGIEDHSGKRSASSFPQSCKPEP
jgi:hypothetical protein